jgi:heme oxygenase
LAGSAPTESAPTGLLPAEPALSELVRERTMAAHHAAETRPFITALMGGELSLGAYTAYAAQLSYVYEALESRPRRAGDPSILDPRLRRADALHGDLLHLGVVDRDPEHPALPATAAYAAYLRGPAVDDLPAYLAHHYTRYLGDLSGGQAIARLVARHYGATDEQLSVFHVEGIVAVPFKRAYRAGLDALPFTADDRKRFLAEADAAFAGNSAIFDELGAAFGVGG